SCLTVRNLTIFFVFFMYLSVQAGTVTIRYGNPFANLSASIARRLCVQRRHRSFTLPPVSGITAGLIAVAPTRILKTA
ncbi:MAG: hypothetical protein PHY64_14685, partial [Eubacteriales bacterium]|nr:hypothetical protein [Eubacteriales bacterium]